MSFMVLGGAGGFVASTACSALQGCMDSAVKRDAEPCDGAMERWLTQSSASQRLGCNSDDLARGH